MVQLVRPADFRIDSSPAALQAFRRGIAEPEYQGTREDLLATPAVLHGRVEPIPIPDAGYGQPPLLERFWQKVQDRLGGAVWVLIAGFALAFCALAAILRQAPPPAFGPAHPVSRVPR